MTAGTSSAPEPRIQPLTALLLSAAVLPGLGQLLTGRLLKGTLMVGAVTLWLPLALIKVGRDLALVLPGLMEMAHNGQPPTFTDLQAALSPMAGGLIWIFAPLLTVWFWALFDSVLYLTQNKNQSRTR